MNLPANKVYIYPSANATDGGQFHKEENITKIIAQLVDKPFVLKTDGDDFKLYAVDGEDTIRLTKGGTICIDGYFISITNVENLEVATAEQSPRTHVVITVNKDTVGHILPEDYDPVLEQMIAYGISISTVQNPASLGVPYIDLGTFNKNLGGVVNTYPEEERFSSLESSRIIDFGTKAAESLNGKAIRTSNNGYGSYMSPYSSGVTLPVSSSIVQYRPVDIAYDASAVRASVLMGGVDGYIGIAQEVSSGAADIVTLGQAKAYVKSDTGLSVGEALEVYPGSASDFPALTKKDSNQKVAILLEEYTAAEAGSEALKDVFIV